MSFVQELKRNTFSKSIHLLPIYRNLTSFPAQVTEILNPQPLAWSHWQLRILKCAHLPLRVIRSPDHTQFGSLQSTLQGYIERAVLWTPDCAMPMDSTNWGHDLYVSVSGHRGNSWESTALGTCKSQSAFLAGLQPTAHPIPEVCCPN